MKGCSCIPCLVREDRLAVQPPTRHHPATSRICPQAQVTRGMIRALSGGAYKGPSSHNILDLPYKS